MKTVKPGHRYDTGGVGADDLLKPGILFFPQQSASRVGPVIRVFNVSPAPLLPDIGVLRGSPEAGIKHEKGEVAIRHLPGSPLLGVFVRVNFFGSGDEVMHNLEVASDVGRILAESFTVANGKLLRALDVIHPVVVVAGVDDIPVAHHLPAAGRAENGICYHLVGVIGAGRVENQFHVPDIVLPDHHLKVVILEVLVSLYGRLIANLPVITPAKNLKTVLSALLEPAGNGMATEAAKLVGCFELREAADIGAR